MRAWTLGALAALIAGGCDSGSTGGSGKAPAPKSGGTRLLLITNGSSDWWSAVEKGMTDAGSKFSATVEMKRNQQKAGTEGQIRLLEEALAASDVRGVAVSVVEDARGITNAMKKLKDAGKLVITIDSDVNPQAVEARQFYIGTDNLKAGEVAGKAAATLRPQGGKVVGFVGTSTAANAKDRLNGFFAGAGPKFSKLEVFEDNHDANKCQSLAEIAITKYPDTGVMLGLYSYNAAKIAIEAAKSPVFRKTATIVTFDLDEQAVPPLEKGDIDVSVCQNPYEIGFQAVKLLKALATDDKATVSEMFPEGKTTLDTGVRIIVPNADSPIKGENVITIKDMKEWLVSKGLKSS
jgi:ribose transport system substrate-binding protein